ncbi:hypothetical protein FACS1894188_12620 [Clostridia bacterium]|nr:hypothetical protein FACS1894188_12620 [Clostridia bacterium]
MTFSIINKYTGEHCGICEYDKDKKLWSIDIDENSDSSTLAMLAKHHKTTRLSDWQVLPLLDEHLHEPNYTGIKNVLVQAGLSRWDRCGLLKYYKGDCCQDELIFEVTDNVPD